VSDSAPAQGAEQFSSTRASSGKLQRRGALTVTQRFQARPEERDRTLIVRIDSANAGQVHALDGESFTVGRHPDNSACIDDQGMSRHHAHIVKKGRKYWIEDLGSSNGTYINGRRVTNAELSNGDTLQFGPRVSFRLSVASRDEEQVLKRLYESSVRDALTQVFNRHYFAAQLLGEVSFALRHVTELSLLILDIDHFKRVNDTLGHPAGDAVLKNTARVLTEQVRTEDVLARYGGEEFVVLLRGISLPGAVLAAERLRKAVAETPTSFDGQDIAVTISLGCANLTCLENPGPEQLVQLADSRLYEAKNGGRNRVVGG
jgi:diguanylate cyclase (GGDEF)-like protein